MLQDRADQTLYRALRGEEQRCQNCPARDNRNLENMGYGEKL